MEYFVNDDAKLKADMHTLIDELRDAKEYGSILNITNVDFVALYNRFEKIRDEFQCSHRHRPYMSTWSAPSHPTEQDYLFLQFSLSSV